MDMIDLFQVVAKVDSLIAPGASIAAELELFSEKMSARISSHLRISHFAFRCLPCGIVILSRCTVL